ncbi:nicotinamide riboside transporter PnuC [Thalassolituus marinus]|uniref:Nicotinamide riboside transporter PnuC n=1 Tax=Thalassolituus marinus TaxID=671053 RepID=A0ABS7ZP58_9GAMM|nr:nicotinamide riboside transporter PnuC [Thalassolituus marinus]MCA6063475.1 nicotinamide mononucleotide transporter [Thalassolituus marinus]
MTDIWNSIEQAAQAMSIWEVVAVALGIAYLLLAMKQSLWCWYAAFGSTAIFVWLFWDVSLVMESALNVYYLAMAVYGWWLWRSGAQQQELPIQSWGAKQHLLAIGAVILISLTSGYLLAENTSAALPYLDSFTTWGAVLTTWMVAKKVLENWLYWIVIDGVAIFLYIDRELYLTALLMAVYVVLVVIGWLQWLPLYKAQQSAESQSATLETPAAWQVGEKLP